MSIHVKLFNVTDCKGISISKISIVNCAHQPPFVSQLTSLIKCPSTFHQLCQIIIIFNKYHNQEGSEGHLWSSIWQGLNYICIVHFVKLSPMIENYFLLSFPGGINQEQTAVKGHKRPKGILVSITTSMMSIMIVNMSFLLHRYLFPITTIFRDFVILQLQISMYFFKDVYVTEHVSLSYLGMESKIINGFNISYKSKIYGTDLYLFPLTPITQQNIWYIQLPLEFT